MTNPFYHAITFNGTRNRNTITNQGSTHATYADAFLEGQQNIPLNSSQDWYVCVFRVENGVGDEVDAKGNVVRTTMAGCRILAPSEEYWRTLD